MIIGNGNHIFPYKKHFHFFLKQISKTCLWSFTSVVRHWVDPGITVISTRLPRCHFDAMEVSDDCPVEYIMFNKDDAVTTNQNNRKGKLIAKIQK